MVFKTQNQTDGLEGPHDKVPLIKPRTRTPPPDDYLRKGEQGGTGRERWGK